MDNKILNNYLERVKEFPTLPTIYSSLMDVMSNPRSTAGDVADIISQDQAAAAKVLKVANSSIYGFYGRITTITQAITFIGFDEVKNLVIALSIINLFSNGEKSNNFNPVDFWKHSIAVAVFTRMIGKTQGVNKIENYFVAGILHQIGKLFLYTVNPEEYSKVIDFAIENKIPFREAESKVLGITYTVAGEMLAQKWNLPNSIVQSIRYHYQGISDTSNSKMISSLHIAKVTALLLGINLYKDEIIPKPNPRAWENVDLPKKYFSNNIDTMVSAYSESIRLLLRQK